MAGIWTVTIGYDFGESTVFCVSDAIAEIAEEKIQRHAEFADVRPYVVFDTLYSGICMIRYADIRSVEVERRRDMLPEEVQRHNNALP